MCFCFSSVTYLGGSPKRDMGRMTSHGDVLAGNSTSMECHHGNNVTNGGSHESNSGNQDISELNNCYGNLQTEGNYSTANQDNVVSEVVTQDKATILDTTTIHDTTTPKLADTTMVKVGDTCTTVKMSDRKTEVEAVTDNPITATKEKNLEETNKKVEHTAISKEEDTTSSRVVLGVNVEYATGPRNVEDEQRNGMKEGSCTTGLTRCDSTQRGKTAHQGKDSSPLYTVETNVEKTHTTTQMVEDTTVKVAEEDRMEIRRSTRRPCAVENRAGDIVDRSTEVTVNRKRRITGNSQRPRWIREQPDNVNEDADTLDSLKITRYRKRKVEVEEVDSTEENKAGEAGAKKKAGTKRKVNHEVTGNKKKVKIEETEKKRKVKGEVGRSKRKVKDGVPGIKRKVKGQKAGKKRKFKGQEAGNKRKVKGEVGRSKRKMKDGVPGIKRKVKGQKAGKKRKVKAQEAGNKRKVKDEVADTEREIKGEHPGTKTKQDNSESDFDKPGTSKKPHRCEMCNKSFSRRYDLQRHMVSHSDTRPHHCHRCERRFKVAGALRQHQAVHTGERRYHCPHCAKTFTQVGSRKRHVKRIHRVEQATD